MEIPADDSGAFKVSMRVGSRYKRYLSHQTASFSKYLLKDGLASLCRCHKVRKSCFLAAETSLTITTRYTLLLASRNRSQQHQSISELWCRMTAGDFKSEKTSF